MKIAFFDTHHFEQIVFDEVFCKSEHSVVYFEPRLSPQSAMLAKGCDVVCAFANDCVNAEVLRILKENGTKLIALRSAGYNHVDVVSAQALSLPIVRVPEYSPYAVAEHAVALLMTLNRKIHKSYARVREMNFSLEGLVGFDVHGKTVGIIGAGRIGTVAAKIFKGFGCRVLVFDKFARSDQKEFEYTELKNLLKESDIISLHLPLTPDTKHILNDEAFSIMKKGVIILNTGRGGLIETTSLIKALKSKKLGGAGLDVYELEEGVFFNDLSGTGIDDDLLARLITFPNVVITSHQAFLTKEALHNIADQTLKNIDAFSQGKLINQVNFKS
jgi:D-lactate dehydrogenase